MGARGWLMSDALCCLRFSIEPKPFFPAAALVAALRAIDFRLRGRIRTSPRHGSSSLRALHFHCLKKSGALPAIAALEVDAVSLSLRFASL
jgi:hypothetical protein